MSPVSSAFEVIDQFADRAQDEVSSVNREVLRAVAALRRDLDLIEAAVTDELGIPGSVSGAPHVESTARDLVGVIRSRHAAYEQVALLSNLSARIVAKVEAA